MGRWLKVPTGHCLAPGRVSSGMMNTPEKDGHPQGWSGD